MSQGGKGEPPPPPPPPPPCPGLLETKGISLLENSSNCPKIENEELDNSIKRLLTSDENLNRIFYTCNTLLRPQLQEGPKCGLVALSIATSATEKFVKVDDILEKAVAQGFTKQGEMFDVKFLASLAEECGFRTDIIDGGLDGHLCCIIRRLANKNLLLVPYDADFNHSPCCKKGHKAHWAIICGVVVFDVTNEGNRDKVLEDNDFLLLNSKLCKCRVDEGDASLSFSDCQGKILMGKKRATDGESHGDFREGRVYLIGMQGKSKHVALWPFQEMAASNDNLVHFSTSRNSERYVIPDGGLPEGLKGKAIFLEYPIKL